MRCANSLSIISALESYIARTAVAGSPREGAERKNPCMPSPELINRAFAGQLTALLNHQADSLSRPRRVSYATRASDVPEFGFKPRVPLTSGFVERTEIDMKLGSVLFEAKLTEADFQSQNAANR